MCTTKAKIEHATNSAVAKETQCLCTQNAKQQINKLNYELIDECRRCSENSTLSKSLRTELEKHCREFRRHVVKKMRSGCAPLFIACKRGCVPIVEYLIGVCDADYEQRGHFEVPEDNSYHYVTPFWCSVVSGKMQMVKYLMRVGCDINATSDSGSTPVRSACFMTHIEIVQYLVENGADIKIPNMNGGTCLINSVQSVQLCLYLIRKGADVNAKDKQDKTALHYAIQEHRLETTKLLLEYGANPFAKSCYGDDALRTACLKGAHHIFDYLKISLDYSAERLAESHELIGSTFLDDHNETRVAILHWRMAHYIRAAQTPFLEKRPQVPKRCAYENAVEFETLEELDNIATDMDAMRIQSLLICERILGITHKDMLFRLTFRGASYADSLQLQRCIDLWRFLLEIRVNNWSILHFETCFAAQALVRLMLNLYLRNNQQQVQEMQQQRNNNNNNGSIEQGEYYNNGLYELHNHYNNLNEQQQHIRGADADQSNALPRFDDVFGVFELLVDNIIKSQKLLSIRPIFRRQQENFDRVLKCVAHLIYLLLKTFQTIEQHRSIYMTVRRLISDTNARSAITADTLLHLCVSRLNVVKSGYITDDTNIEAVFPDAQVIKFLIDCGIDVNVKNESKCTPLHVASQPYNYCNEIVQLLLKNGADLDQPNCYDESPFEVIASNPACNIPLVNYVNLKCLAASVISKQKIAYKGQLPKHLEHFVQLHEP